MNLFAPALAFVDLETTGTAAAADAITEVGIVRVDADPTGLAPPAVTEWSTLVNPGVPIPPAIQALTGITDAMVRDAPPFRGDRRRGRGADRGRRVRRAQRALRLRLPQARVRARRAAVHRARAVHGQAVAPAVSRRRTAQPRQRDRAARAAARGPPSRARRRPRAVGVRADALPRTCRPTRSRRRPSAS